MMSRMRSPEMSPEKSTEKAVAVFGTRMPDRIVRRLATFAPACLAETRTRIERGEVNG